MTTLYHYPFCPHSRFIRLILHEMSLGFTLVEERPWEPRSKIVESYCIESLPVLCQGDAIVIPGPIIISEYLDEVHGESQKDRRLFPTHPLERLEVRRLTTFFHTLFSHEVTEIFMGEKVYKRFLKPHAGGGAPNTLAIRNACITIRNHLSYLDKLAEHRNWIGGERLSYADLCAAAHLSCIDYLGDVPWNEYEMLKSWYARVKSRPSFRSLLADRIPAIAPVPHYTDLDF
jgi:glutathione S-transferase